MTELNGILVVDKPNGWTSHDVVQKAKNLLGARKVGHTGTLDPSATGLLVLLVGSATKSARLFENDRKRYHAEITFGRATDTYDGKGKTTAHCDPELLDLEELEKALEHFKGVIEQVPPMFSALKINGRKLYELARSGRTVERKTREVTIFEMNADLSGYPVITLDIECSKGTYVRSIAHELGETVGCPAYLSALIRTGAGEFTLDDAVDFLSIAESGDVSNLRRMIRPVPLRSQVE